MDNQAQLSWEARFARVAAISAFLAVASEVATFSFQVAASNGAPSRDDALRYSKTLLKFDDNSSAVLASGIAHGVGAVFMAGVLFYLFRATRHRRAELPQMVQWLIPLTPILILVGAIGNWSGLKDAADKFDTPTTVAAVTATPTKTQRKDIAKYCRDHARGSSAVAACRRTHERREAVAKKLIDDSQGPLTQGALLAGSVALAFIFVIVSLNAMRAGLLSRFMGILGIIVGALVVLPLVPIPIVQLFWLGAVGSLFLGHWPGGRGPAWETGTAEPWPTPQRPGLEDDEDYEDAAEPEPEPDEPEEEPDRPHPVSKKRKRKRKR